MGGGNGGWQNAIFESTGGMGGRSSYATTNGTIQPVPFINIGEGAANGTHSSSTNVWNNNARRASGGAGGLFGAGGNAAVFAFTAVAGSGAANSGAGGGGAICFDNGTDPAISGNGGSGRVVVTWIG